jgi:hypothetical protein
MLWYSTETVMALHKARVADQSRARRYEERRDQRTAGPTPTPPAMVRSAFAR